MYRYFVVVGINDPQIIGRFKTEQDAIDFSRLKTREFGRITIIDSINNLKINNQAFNYQVIDWVKQQIETNLNIRS